MRFASCTFLFCLVALSGCTLASAIAQQPLTFETGKWITIQLALVGNRLVVFASDDGRPFFKTHDLRLPDVPPEGHICFQHEELGNAHEAKFDAISIWQLDKAFDVEQFAAHAKRFFPLRPGSPTFVDDFSCGDLSAFVRLYGE